MKGKPKLHILCGQINANIPKSPISQFAVFKQLTSLKIIELNRVSIFFHEILKINVEFGVEVLVRPLKNMAAKILKNARQISEFGRQIF